MRRAFLVSLVSFVLVLAGDPAQAHHGGDHHLILAGPDSYTAFTSANFAIGGTPTDCWLDNQRLPSCTTTFTDLETGNHTFVVQGSYTPDGGSPTTTTEWWSWYISPDETKPNASLTAPTEPFQLDKTASVTWTGADLGTAGIKEFTLARKRAPYNGNFGAITYATFGPSTFSASVSLAAGATDCFAIRAIDKARNVGDFSPWRCTSLPLDDRSMSRSAGWSSGTSAAYFNSTFTSASSVGRTLTRTNAQIRRVGVIATRCAKCGTVAVRVGSTTVGKINLYSSTTKYRQLLTVPVFSLRTGTVSIVSTSSAKLILVDGLALSRQ